MTDLALAGQPPDLADDIMARPAGRFVDDQQSMQSRLRTLLRHQSGNLTSVVRGLGYKLGHALYELALFFLTTIDRAAGGSRMSAAAKLRAYSRDIDGRQTA